MHQHVSLRALFVGVALLVRLAAATDEGAAAFRGQAQPIWEHRAEGVGDLLPDFTWRGLDGSSGTLTALLSGGPAEGPLVLVLREPDCPLCKRYGPSLAALASAYSERANFAWLVVGEGLDEADAERATRDQGLQGPVLLDPDGDIAALLGAHTTTECFLIDRGRTLRYRGSTPARVRHDLDGLPARTHVRGA